MNMSFQHKLRRPNNRLVPHSLRSLPKIAIEDMQMRVALDKDLLMRVYNRISTRYDLQRARMGVDAGWLLRKR